MKTRELTGILLYYMLNKQDDNKKNIDLGLLDDEVLEHLTSSNTHQSSK